MMIPVRPLSAPLVIFLAATTLNPAIAQQETGSDEEQEIREVVVTAPVIYRRREQVTRGGMQEEVIEMDRRVSVEDLDLSRSADVAVLESRIEALARDACTKLDQMFPMQGSSRRDLQRCISRAIESAEKQKQMAIAEDQREQGTGDPRRR